MKHPILIFAMLITMACGGSQSKPTDADKSESVVLHNNLEGDSPKWAMELDSLKREVNRNRIDVYLKYNKPFGRYEVTMLWQPFESQRCETGLVIVNFRDTIADRSFQYVNTEKYNNYHTDKITSAEGFKGYNDGDILYLDATVPDNNPYPKSPLNYYEPFVLYDADFDGEEELLISDWGQSQQGNIYTVYDITANGLVEKVQPPFDAIDNCTKFHPDTRQIETFTHGGVFSEETRFYTIAEDEGIYEAAIESVFRSPVYRDNGKDEYWFEFTKYESNQDILASEVGLKITHNNIEVFNENICWNGEFRFNCNDFFPTTEDSVVRISDAALYFVDVDFDGVDEIITNLTLFAGSQRDCSAYRSIYKLQNGRYIDVYGEFASKCDMFSMLDTYGVEFDYKTKEIYHSNIAGVYRYLDVYSFSNGRYSYDRRIEYEPHDGTLTIFNAKGDKITVMKVTESDIEQNWLSYVRRKKY